MVDPKVHAVRVVDDHAVLSAGTPCAVLVEVEHLGRRELLLFHGHAPEALVGDDHSTEVGLLALAEVPRGLVLRQADGDVRVWDHVEPHARSAAGDSSIVVELAPIAGEPIDRSGLVRLGDVVEVALQSIPVILRLRRADVDGEGSLEGPTPLVYVHGDQA